MRRVIAVKKTFTAEVTYEMSEANQYYELMQGLGVPIGAQMTCPQAPKPNYNGYVSWTWDALVEVDL